MHIRYLVVERYGRADEILQRGFVDRVSLVEIDGAPGVPFEAGVEQMGRVLQRGALEEGHLNDGLVGLPRAHWPVVVPDRDPPPLPRLGDVRVRLEDEPAQLRERSASPVAQLGYPLADELGG